MKQKFSIPYGKQSISEADILTVIETLKSEFLTQGPKVKEFEEAFAAMLVQLMQLPFQIALLLCTFVRWH